MVFLFHLVILAREGAGKTRRRSDFPNEGSQQESQRLPEGEKPQVLFLVVEIFLGAPFLWPFSLR
jgi:hypothetical protein